MTAPAPTTLPTVLFFTAGHFPTPEERAAMQALPARVIELHRRSLRVVLRSLPEACDGVAAFADESIPAAYRDHPRVELPSVEAA